MHVSELKPGVIVRGPALPEPVEILVVKHLGEMIKLDGRGMQTGPYGQNPWQDNQVITSVSWISRIEGAKDLLARKPHSHDDKTVIDVRFVEVKGRAGVEYRTAERLKKDYWLHVAFHCAATPELHVVQDPTRLGWQAVMAVAHHQVGPQAILGAELA